MTNLDSILKSRDITLHYITLHYIYITFTLHYKGQGYGFPSSHVWMWELDSEESWAQKKLCFWTVLLAKTLERPLDCKEIQSVHPKGDKSWVFIGRADAEAEILVLCPPHVNS